MPTIQTYTHSQFSYAFINPLSLLRELSVLLMQLLSVIAPNPTCISHIQRACSSPGGWAELLDPGTISPLRRLYNLRVLIFVLSGQGKEEGVADKFCRSGGLGVVSKLLEDMLHEASKVRVSVGHSSHRAEPLYAEHDGCLR